MDQVTIAGSELRRELTVITTKVHYQSAVDTARLDWFDSSTRDDSICCSNILSPLAAGEAKRTPRILPSKLAKGCFSSNRSGGPAAKRKSPAVTMALTLTLIHVVQRGASARAYSIPLSFSYAVLLSLFSQLSSRSHAMAGLEPFSPAS